MGIKYIHVTLIAFSIVLALGFGFWAMSHHYAPEAVFSFIAAAGLIFYCVNFIKKMKVL